MKNLSYEMLIYSILSFVIATAIIIHPTVEIRAQQPTSIKIDKGLSNSQLIFPFTKAEKIYGLMISGSIDLYKDYSLIRVILVGEDFHEYIVYEAYPLIVDNSSETIINECEETCITEGIMPHSLKTELIDAFLQIDEIMLTDYPQSLAMIPAEAIMQIKEERDADKIKKINKKRLKWIAGETSASRLFYEEKKKLFGRDKVPNLQGAEFYKGGVLEIESEVNSSSLIDDGGSSLIESFDWRNRHGANDPNSPYYDGDATGSGWLTSITNQSCGDCWAHSAVGLTEALANLYFNKHIDVDFGLDLSVQDVLSCSGAGSCSGGSMGGALSYIANTGVVDENCFPYAGNDKPCEDKCPNPDEIITINSYDGYGPPDEEESIKRKLINHGPLNFGISSWHHYMCLVGYDKDSVDDETIWILKNSWGTGWGENGYGRLKVALTDIYGLFTLQTPANSLLTPFEIACNDFDGDGYYNWGIADDKPSSCPIHALPEKDCDDFNSFLGPFDVNGYCLPIQPNLFQSAVNYDVGEWPNSVAIGDLNGDANADLAVANSDSDNVSVLLGRGDGGFQRSVNYGAGDYAYSVAIGDLNGDDALDLAIANWARDNVSVLLGNGDGSFQSAVNYGTGDTALSVAIGDLDGDGDLDLAVANQDSDNVSVLLGNGDGSFQSAVNYDASECPSSVAIGDLNGDGDLDLAVANRFSDNVSVLLGYGDGSFQSAVNYGAGEWPSSVAIGDLNGDANADLAVANMYSDVSVLLGRGDGSFQSAVNYDAGAVSLSVAIGDLNGDGYLDLAVANRDSGNVSVLLGYGDGSFQSAVNYGAGEWPSSVAIGDLNGDGDLDFAVANMFSDNASILINTGVKQNPNNGHWYQRFDNTMTWHEAKSHCENIGGHLATITSLDENLFVYKLFSGGWNRAWLGATDEQTEGIWEWVTGEPWGFTNWAPGEPNNLDNENYLEMYGWAEGRWNDVYNSGEHDFTICEWDQPNYCIADLNGDRDVDGSDLTVFAADYGRIDCYNGPLCEGDIDNDNDVDEFDLTVFATDFSRTNCPNSD
jgi:C1A family cysteine protease